MRREDRWLWMGLGVLALVLLAGPMLGGGMGMLGGRGMMGWSVPWGRRTAGCGGSAWASAGW